MLAISPALARKRIDYIDRRLKRSPDHPQKKKLLANRKGFEAIISAAKEPSRPRDRLLGRVETLVVAIRKVNAALNADAKHPNKKRLLERRAEYRVSLENIQEYGSERKPTLPTGVKIAVPADVLEQRSGS